MESTTPLIQPPNLPTLSETDTLAHNRQKATDFLQAADDHIAVLEGLNKRTPEQWAIINELASFKFVVNDYLSNNASAHIPPTPYFRPAPFPHIIPAQPPSGSVAPLTLKDYQRAPRMTTFVTYPGSLVLVYSDNRERITTLLHSRAAFNEGLVNTSLYLWYQPSALGTLTSANAQMFLDVDNPPTNEAPPIIIHECKHIQVSKLSLLIPQWIAKREKVYIASTSLSALDPYVKMATAILKRPECEDAWEITLLKV